MALDTQQKRQAIVNMEGILICLPIPDGSDFATQGERKLMLGLAAAITSDEPPPTVAAAGNARRRFLRFLGRR